MTEEGWARLVEAEADLVRTEHGWGHPPRWEGRCDKIWEIYWVWADWAEEQGLGYEGGLRKMAALEECPARSTKHTEKWVWFTVVRFNATRDIDDLPEEIISTLKGQGGTAVYSMVYFDDCLSAVKGLARVRSTLRE